MLKMPYIGSMEAQMMRMQKVTAIFAIAAALVAFQTMLTADAQDKKKQTKSETETSQPASKAGVWPPCRGMLWADSQCVREDGKVCRVDVTTGGQAILASCR
jgi:hypothetical protein